MHRTPLKRRTALKNKMGLKRNPMKRHFNVRTPEELTEYKAVCLRAGGEWVGNRCIGGKCEDCDDKNLDWRGHQFSHEIHRKLGGRHGEMRKIINHRSNIKYRCAVCHDLKDGRTKNKEKINKNGQLQNI
jgi:hypothetical protein